MSLVRAGVVASLIKDKEPKTAQELSVATGVEELLIGKFNLAS